MKEGSNILREITQLCYHYCLWTGSRQFSASLKSVKLFKNLRKYLNFTHIFIGNTNFQLKKIIYISCKKF